VLPKCTKRLSLAKAMSSKSKVPQTVNGGKIEIGKKLGAGCFGEVFKGVVIATKQDVAVKFEDASSNSAQKQLEHEAGMLLLMAKDGLQPQGFAEHFYHGKEGNYYCLVMEFLGKSLEDRVQGQEGKFTAKTSCLVAEQLLMRIEYLHAKCIVHRDIKPENFIFGVKEKIHHLYLIDFGLSKKYFDPAHSGHAPMRTKLSLTGTARYASINAHKGIEQSRRDDLEAIGHMLLYFLRGHLPWSGLDAKSKAEKYRKIMETKENTDLKELCSGFPEAFQTYLEYARNLQFDQRPDYKHCHNLFANVRKELDKAEGREIQDWEYDWTKEEDCDGLVPLLPYTGISQPDEKKQVRRGFCCFGGSQVDD